METEVASFKHSGFNRHRGLSVSPSAVVLHLHNSRTKNKVETGGNMRDCVRIRAHSRRYEVRQPMEIIGIKRF